MQWISFYSLANFTGDIFRKYIRHSKPFPKQDLVFTCLQNKSFENTVGKGEIALNEQSFSLRIFNPFG